MIPPRIPIYAMLSGPVLGVILHDLKLVVSIFTILPATTTVPLMGSATPIHISNREFSTRMGTEIEKPNSLPPLVAKYKMSDSEEVRPECSEVTPARVVEIFFPATTVAFLAPAGIRLNPSIWFWATQIDPSLLEMKSSALDTLLTTTSLVPTGVSSASITNTFFCMMSTEYTVILAGWIYVCT